MMALVPIGLALLGAVGGFVSGAWYVDKFHPTSVNDFGIGMGLYGLFGALVGGFVGVVVGSLLVAFVL